MTVTVKSIPKLRTGSITIDLVTGGIYGDLDHCPKEELLESAEVLLSILPRIKHKGLWGMGKAYDADCYLYTTKSYKLPEGIEILANIDKGPMSDDKLVPTPRPARLIVFDETSREKHWQYDWYSMVVGSVKDGHARPDTEGVPDHYRKLEYTPVPVSPVGKKGPAYGQQKMY